MENISIFAVFITVVALFYNLNCILALLKSRFQIIILKLLYKFFYLLFYNYKLDL